MVPEYENKKLWEKIYQNYRIVYRIKKDANEIVAICYGGMILKNIL
ncbi:MAG: type II toxin-antitoxin system RelE/ParE family toxin [Deltaproteobacteria bacterium]|nr:type II toxin-antitoxin system RelE/ParE family toxin [Deltaproteobacteria bacterium]